MSQSTTQAATGTVIKRHPPGPRGNFLLGNLLPLNASPQEYMARSVREYGSAVCFRMPWPMRELILLNDPQLIKRVFIDEADAFRKGINQRRGAPVVGKGLLLAEGAEWKRQRRMVQPAFQRTKLESQFPTVATCAEAMAEDCRRGGERELISNALRVTLRVAAQTLFGAKLGSEDAELIARIFEHGYAATDASAHTGFLSSVLLPITKARSLLRAGRALETLVYRFIAERRASGEDRGDLLSMLLKARDEDGSGLTDLQIRDEAVTAFIAGSETAAVSLAWTFYLLAQHPEIADQVREEIANVVGPGPLGFEHLSSLTLLERVLKESLRLYPPLWRIHREALRDVEFDNFIVPRGAQVVAAPYLVQRDATYFSDPETFVPARWTEEFAQALPKFAYFPFGGGQRICIGANFAMMELAVVIATVLPRIHLDRTDRTPVVGSSSILRPAGGLHLSMRSF